MDIQKQYEAGAALGELKTACDLLLMNSIRSGSYLVEMEAKGMLGVAFEIRDEAKCRTEMELAKEFEKLIRAGLSVIKALETLRLSGWLNRIDEMILDDGEEA